MTKIKPAINQFNGGEISPELEGRFDWDKYNYSAKLCKNFIPLVEGSLKRRGGTHFVGTTENTPIFTIKFVFSFNDSSEPKNIEARIDDTSSNINTLEYNMSVKLGDVFDYNFYSAGYTSHSGTVEAFDNQVINIDFINLKDLATLRVFPDPEDAVCILNGVERKEIQVEKGSTVEINVTYRNETEHSVWTVDHDMDLDIIVRYVAYRSRFYEKAEEILLNRGKYLVWAVGGAGGAGGGTYGDGHKSTGTGGGSGAFYDGYINLEGKYTVDVGRGGAGGHSGNDKWDASNGGNGTETIIYGVLSLGGGSGGARGGGKGNPDYYGKGGVASVLNSDAVLGTPVNGNDATGSGAKKYTGGVSPSGNSNFDGGSGVYKRAGQIGNGGRLVITYAGKWS